MIDIEKVQKAIELTKQGKFDDAKDIYDVLLKDYPNDSNLLSVIGLFYVNMKNYEVASKILKKACSINETFGSVSALGFAEFESGNYADASFTFEKALNYGKNVDIYDKLITSLFEIKSYKKAIEYSNEMFELYPDEDRAVACKIKSLTQSGEFSNAEKLCVDFLKKNQNSSILWMQLGFLKELIYCDDNQAKECYKIAKKLGTKTALYNIAVSCQKLAQFEEAETYYKKMLDYYPNDIDTIVSLGLCYLSQKKFKEGYDLYFNRDKSKYKSLSNNFWKKGESLDNEINIICDQGYGDSIQFIRYIKKLGDRKINIATRSVLQKLFQENLSNLNYLKYEELNPDIQTIFLTDIAFILGIDFDNIPYSEGYLDVKPAEIHSEKQKVGFCWEAGSSGLRTMINRTINVKFFEEMFNLENIQPYSFQVDDSLNGNEKYSDKMINLAKDFNDFYDTAKAIKAMDIVVTVDTAIAHLAGALGVKTYLLLPYSTDWRWFNDTKNTPWYKNMKIFKQTNPISWEEQIKEIIELLK